MTLRAFCNRCDNPGGITSLKFAGNISVGVAPQPQDHLSLCEDCVAELMLEAVISLEDTPTTRDYLETKQRAAEASKAYLMIERVSAERDDLKDKLQDARSESTTAARYDVWGKERAALTERIEPLEAARDVALTRASQAEAKAADVLKRAQAAATQAKADEKGDPEYVASVAAREAKRAGGRP